MKDKIIILSGAGLPAIAANNVYTSRLSTDFDLVIVEENIGIRRILLFVQNKLKSLGFLYVANFICLRFFRMFFARPQNIEKKYTPAITVNSINSQTVSDLLNKREHKFVITNACSILKPETINAAATHIINLHNGINPRYRGTGNFWAFHEANYQHIGTTIHYIDEGIDTGKIISILPDDETITHGAFENIDINAFKLGAEEISRIVKGDSPKGIADEYKNMESACYTFPGLTQYLQAKRNFETNKIRQANKEDVWQRSFAEKASDKEGDALEQQHWTDKNIVEWHDSIIFGRVNQQKQRKVLDIGCGDARHAQNITDLEFYIGIDYSFETIKIGKDSSFTNKTSYSFPVSDDSLRKNFLSKGNILLLESRADHLPIQNNSVDLILAIGLLQHLGNTEPVIKEMSRTLQTGGKIFINTLHQFSALELLAIFMLLGWKKDIRNLVYAIHKKSYGSIVNDNLLARRYSKKEIELALIKEGLKVDGVTYNGILGTRLMAREIIVEASHV